MKKKNKRKTVALPYMGKYYVPLKYLLTHVLHAKVFVSPKKVETNQSLPIQFTCMTFSNTLKGWIESLEKGADILLHFPNQCVHSDLNALQMEILKELGYQFEAISFSDPNKFGWYRLLRKINGTVPLYSYLKYIRITKYMIHAILKIETMIQNRIGFEMEEGSFENLEREMLHQFLKVKSLNELKRCYRKYKKRMKNVKIEKQYLKYRVIMTGRIEVSSDLFSSYQLQKLCTKKQILICSFPQVSIFSRRQKKKKVPNPDGVFHIKPFFCPYETVEDILLEKKYQKEGIPFVSMLSQDQMTDQEVGKFLDFLIDGMKKKRNNKINVV